MKKYFFILFCSLIVSCSPDEKNVPSLITQSYTAEIGDLVTITGTNLLQVETVRIFSTEYNVPGATIYNKPGELLHHKFFTFHSDTEIQFVLPQLYAESYVMQIGTQEIPLRLKGFIPLFEEYPFELQEIMGLKVLNDEEALGTTRVDIPTRNLHLFKNGFYETQKISSNVQFFNVLENADSWYAKSTDFNLYEIYYKSSSSPSYSFLNSFNTRDLDYLSMNPDNILITPEKQIFIFTQNGIFIKQNNELKKAVELFEGLEAYPKQERNIFDLKLTSQGNIHGKVILNPGASSSDYEYAFISMNPKNFTFNISERLLSEPVGPQFKSSTGYFLLPRNKKLYKTTDSGLTWSESATPIPYTDGYFYNAQIKVLDAQSILLFLHTSTNDKLPYTTVYKSSDGGDSWQLKKRFNHPRQVDLFLFQSDFANRSGLFYFTNFSSRQLWKYLE